MKNLLKNIQQRDIADQIRSHLNNDSPDDIDLSPYIREIMKSMLSCPMLFDDAGRLSPHSQITLRVAGVDNHTYWDSILALARFVNDGPYSATVRVQEAAPETPQTLALEHTEGLHADISGEHEKKFIGEFLMTKEFDERIDIAYTNRPYGGGIIGELRRHINFGTEHLDDDTRFYIDEDYSTIEDISIDNAIYTDSIGRRHNLGDELTIDDLQCIITQIKNMDDDGQWLIDNEDEEEDEDDN